MNGCGRSADTILAGASAQGPIAESAGRWGFQPCEGILVKVRGTPRASMAAVKRAENLLERLFSEC
jgi:hypothetical protein